MPSILVIEDNIDINETTSELLEMAGFQVLKAHSGRDGVALAGKDFPDLILCDVWMPENDGYFVLNQLRESKDTRHIPLIFFSASTEPRDVKKGLAEGAVAYICKPFTEEELLQAVREVLEEYN